MRAELFVLGTSQSVASTCVRQRMHVDLDEVYAALARLRAVPGLLDEALPVATCGRLEVYCLSSRPGRALRILKELMSIRTGLGKGEIEGHSYTLYGEDAARHLFRVASGLDSVVYGEAQILGQVRDALQHPATRSVADTFLQRLFEAALAAGKRVRAETDIGRGSASVAGAALCLLEAEAKSFENKSALVLGAGETGKLVARLLRKAGVGKLAIANRTLSSAESLAAELGGEAYGLDSLADLVRGADIIVGAVTDRDDLVTAAMLEGDGSEGGRTRYLLDLAHPRNFSVDLDDVAGVRVLDLEEIFHQVALVREARAAQVPRAEAIVDAEVEDFVHWVRSRESAPVLRAVREQVLTLAQEEAERRSKGLPPEVRDELTRFARSLARTLLHAPTVAIRDADPSTPQGQWLLDSAPALFGVQDDPGPASGGVQ